MSKNNILTSADVFEKNKLPIRVRYTESSSELGFHSHEFTEIAIMFSGEATYLTEFSSVRLHAGDVVVIPAGAPHCYTDECNKQLMNLIFIFDQLPIPYREIYRNPGFSALFVIHPDYYRKNRFYPKFSLPADILEQLKTILFRAWEIQRSRQICYNLSVFGAFCEAIPLLLAGYDANEKIAMQDDQSRMADCMDYISRHFKDKLSLSQLARRANMSESTFLRHFRLATGMTPVGYIQSIRLRHAAGELLDSSRNLADIAREAGFTDGNYFARLFRREFGQTPREYRRDIAKNI
ncbi:MAG: helix-turn-helix domain-containing protein [Lentisphaeria bacterium]|nr:helix-turn-helix domain-containing protein [Lentisphaeria bacterium]